MKRFLVLVSFLVAAVAAADILVTFRDAQTETGPMWTINRNAANPLNYDCETTCTAHDTGRTIKSRPRRIPAHNQPTRNGCLLALDALCTASYALDAGVP